MIITVVVWHVLSDKIAEKRQFFKKAITVGTISGNLLQATRALVIFFSAIIVHYILDDLAIHTYHPPGPEADWGNLVFAVWTLGNIAIVSPLFLFLMVWRDRRYLWGLFGSILIDLWDWGFIKGLAALAGHPVFPEAIMHSAPRPLFQLLAATTPDFTRFQWAILIEVLYMAGLLAGWLLLKKRWPLPPKKPGHVWPSIILVVCFGIVTCYVVSSILVPIYPW